MAIKDTKLERHRNLVTNLRVIGPLVCLAGGVLALAVLRDAPRVVAEPTVVVCVSGEAPAGAELADDRACADEHEDDGAVEPKTPDEPVEPVEPPVPSDAVELPGLMLLLEDGSVMLGEEADPDWGQGPVRVETGFSVDVAGSRAVSTSRLPPPFAAVLGVSVQVYGRYGRVCDAVVDGDARMLARFQSHDDEALLTDDEMDRGTGDKVSPVELARRSFERVSSVLVADLRPAPGEDCSGGVWARPTSLPAPTVLVPVKPQGAERAAWKRARNRILRSDSYRRLKEEYLWNRGPEVYKEDWPAFIRARFRLDLWRDVEGTHRVFAVEYGDLEYGSDCDPDLGLAEVRGIDASWDDTEPALGGLGGVTAIADIDGDGSVEVIGRWPSGYVVDSRTESLGLRSIVEFSGDTC